MPEVGKPRATVTVSADAKVISLPAEGSPGLRILVVDDSAEDREFFRRLLREGNRHVDELLMADCAGEALVLCRQVPVDCMLLDYRLPDLSGLEVLAELRRGGTQPMLPVVVLTGQGDESVHEQAMQAGAQDYLVKGQVTGDHLWLSIRHAIERHRLVHALREQELQLRAILATAPDGIVTFDEHGRIASFNLAAESLFDYRAEAVIGTDIGRYIPGLGPIAASRARGEFAARRADGAAVQVEVTLSRTALSRRLLFTAIVRDITERKIAEGNLQEAIAAAELANRARRDFIATASHDLRTPAHIIVGMIDMIADSEVTPYQRELLGRARAAAEAIGRLSSDLSDFVRIDAGRLRLEPCEFDVRLFLRTVVDGFMPVARKKSLFLHLEVTPEVPRMVAGDPVRIRQVMTNLLSNALKFTDKGEVKVRALVVEERASQVVIRFEVRDTGIGLAPQMYGRLFQPFSQGDPSRYEGTGLGLAICKKLVNLMGGQIGIESTRGQGSLFWFNLPLHKAGTNFSLP